MLPATEATEPPNGAAQPSAAGSKRPADGNAGAAPSSDAKGKVRKRISLRWQFDGGMLRMHWLSSTVIDEKTLSVMSLVWLAGGRI